MAHGHRQAGLVMLRRAEAWYSAHTLLRPPTDAERHQHMLTLLELENWADASATAKSILSRLPNESMERAIIGMAAAISGDSTSARAQMALLIQSGRAPDHIRLYEAAKIATALGETNQAVELLRRAFASGHPHTFWDHLATAFQPLRDVPAYQELMRPRL
jgi:thioredoxin-like negative regulator of GroEL